ncbi:DUF4012 domain-containing protein [Arthrobacter sp. Leaf137]|uniref:DUF4012 domain-containing protein n=1 Tax=Arthrobacter sp. Leaf137 TaxID=1736271 RepID=UPI0009EA1216|nr:DUF4012 domain-containing protein [Arthrobacter sp. Leaf137]
MADDFTRSRPRAGGGDGRVTASSGNSFRLRYKLLFSAAGFLVLLSAAMLWVVFKASTLQKELEAANALIAPLQETVSQNKPAEAESILTAIRLHTAAAKDAANDPFLGMAAALPGLGSNFSAVSEVARSADDVANLGLTPLVEVFESLNWDALVPSDSGADLGPLTEAGPKVASAAYAVRESAQRLNQIDSDGLLPQVAEPLNEARDQLSQVSHTLDAAADASGLLPTMLGGEAPRNYLLVIQNNAEARASGGIPGALALLTVDKGKLSLGAQSSASQLGSLSPPLTVDQEQQDIYSSRLGKFVQDVNLTPDFPTAAATVQSMWQRKTGQRVDGVVSVDPVLLSYILEATGPVSVDGSQLATAPPAELPTKLTGTNVVPTLLSDVYAKIQEPKLQDAYFAGVAKEVFSALSSGQGEPKKLLAGLNKGTEEGRVLVWSVDATEQAVISRYPLSGSISGPSISPAQFGVYFNDGTGAKMDYYVKRQVQLVKECQAGGYEQTSVRVTSTNTAPRDAGTSLPEYVTGGGVFGVPPGSVQTNIVAYGPVQANIESATIDGQRTSFAPYLHSSRPVGVLSQRLAPGESQTIEFTFGKIVQHTEPNLFVTPTVQPLKDVVLPTESSRCDVEQ